MLDIRRDFIGAAALGLAFSGCGLQTKEPSYDTNHVNRVGGQLPANQEAIRLGKVGGDTFYLREIGGTFLLVSSAPRVNAVIEHVPAPGSWSSGSHHEFEVMEVPGKVAGQFLYILKLDGVSYAYVTASDGASITRMGASPETPIK